jgi:enoyl-CoA hydratase
MGSDGAAPTDPLTAEATPSVPARAPVRYEREGSAALLTIDRPERRNAVDGATAVALHEAFARFEADEEARVLVLTGAGGVAFCAGADLKAIETYADRLGAPGGPMGFTRLTPSKPTIAAISGFALAGGLELALWCDLRIATEDSRLGFPERRWGVPLIDGGTQRLPRIVGLGRALDMILTGRIMDAAEAHAMGLVNELVAPGRHLERALELAQNLARFPQRTMLADRRAAIEGFGMPLREALALEAQAGPEVFQDAVAGAARFAGGEGRGGAGAGA